MIPIKKYGYTLRRFKPIKIKFTPSIHYYFPVYIWQKGKKTIRFVLKQTIAELIDEPSCTYCPRCGLPCQHMEQLKHHFKTAHKDNHAKNKTS